MHSCLLELSLLCRRLPPQQTGLAKTEGVYAFGSRRVWRQQKRSDSAPEFPMYFTKRRSHPTDSIGAMSVRCFGRMLSRGRAVARMNVGMSRILSMLAVRLVCWPHVCQDFMATRRQQSLKLLREREGMALTSKARLSSPTMSPHVSNF